MRRPGERAGSFCCREWAAGWCDIHAAAEREEPGAGDAGARMLSCLPGVFVVAHKERMM